MATISENGANAGVTAVLTACGTVFLEPFVNWLFFTPNLSFSFRPIAAGLLGLFFLYSAWGPYVPVIPDIGISFLRSRLSPLTSNPWFWVLIGVIFWGYLAIPPIVTKIISRSATSKNYLTEEASHIQHAIGSRHANRQQEENLISAKIETQKLQNQIAKCSGVLSGLVQQIKDLHGSASNIIDPLMRAKFHLMDVQQDLINNPHDMRLLNSETGANFELQARENIFDQKMRDACS